MTAPTRPVLRYHGGKWMLAPWIIAHFPPHRVYVEPFGGAGSVLMRKPRSYSECYNDRWGRVVEVFRVLRDADTAAELRRRLELTPFARDEFAQANEWDIAANPDPVERVRLSILRSFAGFGSASTNGDYATGFRSNSNRSGTTPAHDWRNYPDVIPAFIERLRGVVIENRDAVEVMRQHDGIDALHYVDPPYLPETRSKKGRRGTIGHITYAYEMTPEDHRALLDALLQLEGMVVLSGYGSALYDGALRGWRRVETIALADGARKRTEVLWLNPACADALPNVQANLFDGAAA